MSRPPQRAQARPQAQRGAAALEFGFIFPLLFMLVYGSVLYGFLFTVRESVEFAAHKAVEAAIAVDPGATNAAATRQTEACRAASSTLYWLTNSSTACAAGRVETVYSDCSGSTLNGCSDGYGRVTVTFKMKNGSSWMFPQIGLPGLGAIPPMPETLVATAIGRLDTP